MRYRKTRRACLNAQAMSQVAAFERLDGMDDPTHVFARLRPRLQGIAYRMLGTVAEAEELVQDVWLRWHDAAHDSLASAEAWLVTVTTRLAIDRLRAAKLQREHYTGLWLPEPVLTDGPATPEQLLERADQLSVAFLRLLERLTPDARAAFLLREVFDADYAELARIVGKSEAACRQLVSRAKAQLREERPRYAVPEPTHRRLLQGFADTLADGDLGALGALFSEDAVLVSDGGGKALAFADPVVGGRRIAQLFFAGRLRHGAALELRLVDLNGELALLRLLGGALETALAVETDGTRITRLYSQRNPDKLARIAAGLGLPVVAPGDVTPRSSRSS